MQVWALTSNTPQHPARRLVFPIPDLGGTVPFNRHWERFVSAQPHDNRRRKMGLRSRHLGLESYHWTRLIGVS